MTDDNSDHLNKSLIRDGVLLLTYLSITIYIFYFLSTSRPHVGMWQELILIISLFGVLRHSFFMFYSLAYKKLASHKLIISIASFVASVLISSLLSNLASNISVNRHIKAYQPMITALYANKINKCKQPDTELVMADSFQIKSKNRSPKDTNHWATIYFSGNDFIIAVTGDSYTKNSSTLYYESKGKQWRHFHNQIYNDMSIFEKLTKNTHACKIKELNS